MVGLRKLGTARLQLFLHCLRTAELSKKFEQTQGKYARFFQLEFTEFSILTPDRQTQFGHLSKNVATRSIKKDEKVLAKVNVELADKVSLLKSGV